MKTHITLYCTILLFGASSIFAGMDDARLKERLKGGLFELLVWDNYDIDKTGVSTEQFHRVLMELYDEAEEKRPSLTHGSEEWRFNQLTVEGVLACLSMCGDIPVKDFLLDYAITKENDNFARTIALSSYLRVADAEEARDVLLRFLIGEDRMDSHARSSIINHARTAFMTADAEKKAAILESLYAALAMEDTKWLFRVYDNLLCDLINQYANSHQRLALLQRLINAPSLCKADDYAMPELQEKLKVLQKTRLHTNISTNLAVLKLRDFNLPQPDLLTNDVAEFDQDLSGMNGLGIESETTVEPVWSPGRYAFIGILALLLIGFGAWRFMRK